jgi:hypothetical protein
MKDPPKLYVPLEDIVDIAGVAGDGLPIDSSLLDRVEKLHLDHRGSTLAKASPPRTRLRTSATKSFQLHLSAFTFFTLSTSYERGIQF